MPKLETNVVDFINQCSKEIGKFSDDNRRIGNNYAL